MAPFGTMEDEIKVITVKNGEGQELKEARFVEIMKSARQRLKSATSLGEFSIKAFEIGSRIIKLFHTPEMFLFATCYLTLFGLNIFIKPKLT